MAVGVLVEVPSSWNIWSAESCCCKLFTKSSVEKGVRKQQKEKISKILDKSLKMCFNGYSRY